MCYSSASGPKNWVSAQDGCVFEVLVHDVNRIFFDGANIHDCLSLVGGRRDFFDYFFKRRDGCADKDVISAPYCFNKICGFNLELKFEFSQFLSFAVSKDYGVAFLFTDTWRTIHPFFPRQEWLSSFTGLPHRFCLSLFLFGRQVQLSLCGNAHGSRQSLCLEQQLHLCQVDLG